MKKKTKIILCVVLCIVSLPLLRLLAIYGIIYVEFGLHDKYPSLFYEGDKNVPQEDVIKIGNVYMRDLKKDRISDDNETRYVYKYYILKKNKLSPSDLNEILSDYCGDFFDAQAEYDEIQFCIFKECPRMPWYWNDDGAGFAPQCGRIHFEEKTLPVHILADDLFAFLCAGEKTKSCSAKKGSNYERKNYM